MRRARLPVSDAELPEAARHHTIAVQPKLESPGLATDSLNPGRVLQLQRTLGNRVVRRMLAAQQSQGKPVIQRVWQRVKRRNFGNTAVGGLDAADRVYADLDSNPRRLLAIMANGGTRYFLRQQGIWIEQFGAGQAVLGPMLAQIGQDAPVVNLPGGVRTHIFDGEPAGQRHAGIHTELDIQPHEVLARSNADASGVYAAWVLLDANQQGKSSLMFPANWDEHDIAEAIRYAVDHLQHGDINGLRFGPSSGAATAFNIGMRLGANNNFANLVTAFPIAYNGNNMLPGDIDALFPNRAALVQAALQQRVAH